MTLLHDTYNGGKTPLGAKNPSLGKNGLEDRDYEADEKGRQRCLIVEHLHRVAHQLPLFLIHPLKQTQHAESEDCNNINH